MEGAPKLFSSALGKSLRSSFTISAAATAPASVVVPYQYSMIVWAVIFGFVVFGDVPSIATLIGAAIIIGAGFYIYLRERDLGREGAKVNPPA